MKRPIFRQFPGFALLGVACMFGCASPVGPDAGADAQPLDTGTADSGGPTDAGATDLGDLDAAPGDAIVADVGGLDTGGADASAVTACDPPTQLD